MAEVKKVLGKFMPLSSCRPMVRRWSMAGGDVR